MKKGSGKMEKRGFKPERLGWKKEKREEGGKEGRNLHRKE